MAETRNQPLAGMTFSLVGPGRVGRSLTRWLVAVGAELVTVASRRSGECSLGRPAIRIDRLETSGQDLLLLAVPDAQLELTARRLSHRGQARVALHTSGARGAEALTPLSGETTETGSIHPLRAFPQELPGLETARETFFALDGSSIAIAMGQRLVSAWKGDAAIVSTAHRATYHLAASIAAGGIATLLEVARDLGTQAGLPAAVADAYRALAGGALDAVAAGTGADITGPAARGESTLAGRLDRVRVQDPPLYPLLVLLAIETIRRVDRASGPSTERTNLLTDLRARCRREDFLDPLVGPF